MDDSGERWDVVPELDALERGRPQHQQPEPDTSLRRAAVRLVGPDPGEA